jgi:hypothetical protein
VDRLAGRRCRRDTSPSCRWHDLLNEDPVAPVVAEVIPIEKRRGLRYAAQTNAGLVYGRRPATLAVVDPILYAADLEFVEMAVQPAESSLQDVV